MPAYPVHLPFIAPIPLGSRIAIEIYDNNRDYPVIVDLTTGIRWGSGVIFGRNFDAAPVLSRRSEVIVRACWVGSDMGGSLQETHTNLVVEEPPKPEGPYR